MSLKLFRSTGYASILSPGETRAATHPGWLIGAVSAWVGFACNVALWRAFTAGDSHALMRAIAVGTLVAAVCGVVLSVLGWRKTLKPAGTLILFLMALMAGSIWAQALPVDASLFNHDLSSLILPSWASLFQWQLPTLLVGLAVVPSVWMWHTHVRRLPGPEQLSINMSGVVLAGLVIAGSGYLLFKGLV